MIIVLTFISVFCFSQNDSLRNTIKKSSNFKLAYNSSLIYPGFRLGIEFPIKTTHITKLKKSGKKKDFVRDNFISTNLSWYHHTKFHDNIYITAGWAIRRIKHKGFFTEFSPEIGYSRTFLGGTTYKADDNGEITVKKFAGYSYALVSIGGGLGYDFSLTKSKPFLIFYKFNLLAMFPYNSTFYLRPAMEIGLTYKPSNFLSLKVKSKEISK